MAAGYVFSGEDHQDLVIEILSRLYVKSLIRCTCVCKSWRRLIKRSYFITKHLHRSRKTSLSNDTEEEEAPLILICNKGSGEWMVSYIPSTFFNGNETEVAALPGSLPFVENYFTPNTMGPVNGIYCWIKKAAPDIEYDTLFLCNPALREVQSIPKIPRRVRSSKKWYYNPCQTYGFGYDYKTNDYKVVAVTGINTSAESRDGLQIFVYTLSSNSWRRMPTKIDNFPTITFERPPVLTDGDGVCHWLAKDDQQHLVTMLSFDFGSEAFKWSPLPQGYGGPNSNKGLCLYGLNESSIMLIALHDRWSRMEHQIKIGCCYEIFRMNEGGSTGEELWTMLYTIEPIPGVRQPLGFRKNGEIVLGKFDGSLVTYDPSCKQIKLLHICREGFEGYQVCTYMESLVPICRGS